MLEIVHEAKKRHVDLLLSMKSSFFIHINHIQNKNIIIMVSQAEMSTMYDNSMWSALAGAKYHHKVSHAPDRFNQVQLSHTGFLYPVVVLLGCRFFGLVCCAMKTSNRIGACI